MPKRVRRSIPSNPYEGKTYDELMVIVRHILMDHRLNSLEYATDEALSPGLMNQLKICYLKKNNSALAEKYEEIVKKIRSLDEKCRQIQKERDIAMNEIRKVEDDVNDTCQSLMEELDDIV